MEDKPGFLKINFQDLVQATANAVVIAVLTIAYGVVTAPGFDVFSTDWVALGRAIVNAAVIAFVASIGTSILTTKEGKLLGSIRVK